MCVKSLAESEVYVSAIDLLKYVIPHRHILQGQILLKTQNIGNCQMRDCSKNSPQTYPNKNEKERSLGIVTKELMYTGSLCLTFC